jgi:ketosteroid isomerase-like protein
MEDCMHALHVGGGALLIGLGVLAPNPAILAQRPLSPARRTAIVDSVRAVADSAFAAGNRRDLERLYSFYSPATTLLHDGTVQDWAVHQASARAFYQTLRSVELRPLDYAIDLLSPTVAVWRGRYAYVLTDTAGHAASGTAAQTWVLTRDAVGWRITHVHISDRLPPPK